MTKSDIRSLPARAIPASLGTLTRAFAADPMVRWAFPDAGSFATGFPELARVFVTAACAAGTAHQIGDRGIAGVAVWLPPGMEPDEGALGALVERHVEAERRAAMLGVFSRMAEAHPQGPHWYLPLIGVDPAWQGLGFGSALLADALRTCDLEGLPAYLEATSPANIALYRRHGFVPLGRIQVDGSPPLTPMRREPVALGASLPSALVDRRQAA